MRILLYKLLGSVLQLNNRFSVQTTEQNGLSRPARRL